MAHSKKSNSKFSLAGLLFGAVFFTLGSGFMWQMGLKPIVRSVASFNWPQVACTVIHSELTVNNSSDGATYKPEIRVSHYYNDQRYEGGSYNFNTSASSGKTQKAAVVKAYPVGKETRCWVNPSNPSEAVIDRAIPGMVWPIIPFMAIFVIVGAVTLASGLGLMPQRWSLSRSHNRVALASTGYTVLKPKNSTGSKIIGFTIFAVVWNGVVGVIFLKGGFVWFVVPFILVGVVVVVLWLQAILSLTNPRPVLSLSEGSPRLGETVSLQWGFTGRSSRLTSLTLVIEACEKAIYRVGTDTRTDTHVFFKKELLNTSSVQDTTQSSVSIDIPKASMHSFTASHNKIEWQIKLHGDIPGWANVDFDYPVIIRPA